MKQYHTVVITADAAHKLESAINKCIEESDYKLLPPIQFDTTKASLGMYYSALLLFIR